MLFNENIIFLLSRHQSQIMATCHFLWQGTQIVYFTMLMPTRGDLIFSNYKWNWKSCEFLQVLPNCYYTHNVTIKSERNHHHITIIYFSWCTKGEFNF